MWSKGFSAFTDSLGHLFMSSGCACPFPLAEARGGKRASPFDGFALPHTYPKSVQAERTLLFFQRECVGDTFE